MIINRIDVGYAAGALAVLIMVVSDWPIWVQLLVGGT